MEDPKALAGADIESADKALHISFSRWRAAFHVRGPDDDDVLGDDLRRMQADLAGDQVDLLVVVHLQVDYALIPEGRHRDAGLGIQSNQAITWRDVEDAFFAAVGPMGDSMAG